MKANKKVLMAVFMATFLFVNFMTFAANDSQTIPPEAGSAFREFMQKIGGKIKYDENLFRGSFEDYGFRAAIFPFGRSLERNFADKLNPRILVNLDTSDGGYVHVAFTPLNNQLQIIASNDSGRGNGGFNDFIVVDDFVPGKNPKIRYAPQGLCTACHQGGNLIFPEGQSWNESQSETYKNARFNSKYKIHPTAIKAGESSLQVWSYDRVIRQQSDRFTARQFFRNICPRNLECRIEILKAALSEKYDISKINQILSQPNSLTFSIGSDLLSDRVASEENIQEQFKFPFLEKEDPLFPRFKPVRNLTLTLADIKQRAIVRDISPNRNLRISDEQIQQLFATSVVKAFVNARWPLQLSEAEKMISDFLTDSRLMDVSWAVKTETEISKPLTDPVAIFSRYCSTCHEVGAAATAIDFSEIETFVGVANKHRNSLELMERRLMPPPDALQMKESERTLLLNYLNRK